MVTGKMDPTAASATTAEKPPRRVAQGDVPPSLTETGIERFVVDAAVGAAQETRLGALRDVLKGMSEEESVALLKGLLKEQRVSEGSPVPNPDDELVRTGATASIPTRT